MRDPTTRRSSAFFHEHTLVRQVREKDEDAGKDQEAEEVAWDTDSETLIHKLRGEGWSEADALLEFQPAPAVTRARPSLSLSEAFVVEFDPKGNVQCLFTWPASSPQLSTSQTNSRCCCMVVKTIYFDDSLRRPRVLRAGRRAPSTGKHVEDRHASPRAACCAKPCASTAAIPCI